MWVKQPSGVGVGLERGAPLAHVRTRDVDRIVDQVREILLGIERPEGVHVLHDERAIAFGVSHSAASGRVRGVLVLPGKYALRPRSAGAGGGTDAAARGVVNGCG